MVSEDSTSRVMVSVGKRLIVVWSTKNPINRLIDNYTTPKNTRTRHKFPVLYKTSRSNQDTIICFICLFSVLFPTLHSQKTIQKQPYSLSSVSVLSARPLSVTMAEDMRREMEEMKRKMEALEKKNERLIRKVEKMENKEVISWEEWWRLENTRAEEAARELVEGGSGEIGTIVVIQEDQAMPNELMKIINLQSQDWTVEKEELDRDRIEKDFKRIQRKVKEMFDPAQETEFWEKRFLAKGKGDSKAEWTEKGMRNMWFAVLPVWRLVMLLQRDTSGLVNVELLVEAMRVSMEKSWLIWSEQQQRAEILRSCPSQLRFETNFVDQVIKAKMSWEKKMERVEREIARLERERGNNVLLSAI